MTSEQEWLNGVMAFLKDRVSVIDDCMERASKEGSFAFYEFHHGRKEEVLAAIDRIEDRLEDIQAA